MNREKLAWTVSLVMIGLLTFSIPGTLAQRDDDYSFVRTLVDIHRQVAANYVDPIDESKLREGAIDGMLGELDPFSVYVPPANQEAFDRMLEGSFKGVGVQLNPLEDGRLEVVTPIEGSPAHKAGVQAGDIILKVNGESVEGLKLPEVQKKIAGPLGSQVKMTVRHLGASEDSELTMTREEIVLPTVKGFGRKDDNSWDYFVCDDPKIAYLRITQFTPDTLNNLKNALQQSEQEGMRGLVLDLRFNPGGRLDQALQILDMFIEKGTLLVTRGRNRPERREEATAKESARSDPLLKLPIIVLVNEHSASASEIVAGSLMDNHRAVVVGQRSYGKGSVQEVIPLDSKGGELKLTVAYYYLPSGRLVHRKKDATDWGVQPQISVPLDNAAEAKILQGNYERELFHRPVVKPSTRGTTVPTATTTSAATLDPQLQRAVDTMMATLILQSEPRDTTGKAVPPVSSSLKPLGLPSTRKIAPEDPDNSVPAMPSSMPASKPAATATRPPATVPTTSTTQPE